MIKIKESNNYPLMFENQFKCKDIFGKQGIDLLNNIKFVYGNEKADIGIAKHGHKVEGVSKDRCILWKGEPPIYDFFHNKKLNINWFEKDYMATMSYCKIPGKDSYHFISPIDMYQAGYNHFSKHFLESKENLLCMVLRNKKSHININSLLPFHFRYRKHQLMDLRRKADYWFSVFLDDYNSYGRGWHPSCYKGELKPKGPKGYLPVYAKHKFTFASENSMFNGYVSEKLIAPMTCGSIPIYIGAPDVTNYVPDDVFIKFNLNSIEDICYKIEAMNEEVIEEYKTNIKKFLFDENNPYYSTNHARNFKEILEKIGI